ncbi:MAG: excinuclease ABC subunit UvrC [Mycoplasmataceae bacterium]|nr:excinuclease ABC subunit UvrC [Mycoplasmataceae bacterium]
MQKQILNKNLQFKLKKIPDKSGVYLWKDINDKIIYVGKAKNLFKRTQQYFNKENDSKTTKLVKNIYDVDFIVVNNENESLILETNLIKKYKPKYNILLRYSYGYPYIVITNEEHPRIVYTKSPNNYRGTYYGPFASVDDNKYEIYNFLQKLFPLRKCEKLKKQRCLYADIEECLAPCINKININVYQDIKKSIHDFFSGKTYELIKKLKTEEKEYANNFQYEKANKIYELIKSIKKISHNQNINLLSKKNIDVIGYYIKNDYITISIFSFINGKLLTKNQQICELNNSINESVTNYIMQYYYNNSFSPKICYVNLNSDSLKNLSETLKIKMFNPKTSKFQDIISTAVENSKTYFESNYLIFKHQQKWQLEAFEEFKKIINIKNLTLINVFDMSNLFNDNKVGAMIALENGMFNKNLYRKFNIKNTNANSDYEYMYEVIKRQYKRTIEERKMLPNLIIVDGGSIQIKAATIALKELKIDTVIPVIGLKKNRQHKTDAIISKDATYQLDKQSNVYNFLLNIQEEIHRFAIKFYHQKSLTTFSKSKLDEIPGIGKKTISKLLSNYENISNIKNAPIEELTQFVSNDIAKQIKKI